jgi:membrane-associated phospholipid phosphatase
MIRKSLLAVCLLILCSGRLCAQSIDYKILEEWNIEGNSAGTTTAFRFFSNNNTFFIVGAPLALLAGGYLKDDPRQITAGRDAFISLGVSTVVTMAMKYTIKRERPFERYSEVKKLSSGGGSSFPSGHTSSAFAVATSISMSYPKWYVIAPCYLWAGAVGVSRIVLGVHYPSDVLAGAVVGMGSAYLANRAEKWLHRGKTRHVVPKDL